MPERTPTGQFSGVAKLSGLEILLLTAFGSVLAILIVFLGLYLLG